MRVIVWCLRVAVAAVAGACVRLVRRMAGRPPRIWHGMAPLHVTPPMVQAERMAGFPTRSVALHSRQTLYALVTPGEFDAVFESDGRWYDAHWRALVDLLWHGDIWSAHFECLFFRPEHRRRNGVAFAVIRTTGIRIVVSAHGGDILHRDRLRTRFDWIERTRRDYPDWDLVAQKKVARERIRLFARHAAMVLPGDSTLLRFLPRNNLLFKYFPVDCHALRPGTRAPRPVPLVVHAPNHRYTKGTDFLLAAVDQLRVRGFELDLQLVEGVPRVEALELYAHADIIADQFCGGAFGSFAMEGMALGKPVLTYLDQEHLGDPVFNVPLVNAHGGNLAAVLAVLLTTPALRERLGKAGRAAVETYHSVEALAEVWKVIHEHVWWGAPLDLSQTKHFSPSRGSRSFTEDPAEPEFWPVDVTGLGEAIRTALARLQDR
jgi:glycosyltransferase involved in cell wall biosynthesis